jgi:hypothetical protein
MKVRIPDSLIGDPFDFSVSFKTVIIIPLVVISQQLRPIDSMAEHLPQCIVADRNDAPPTVGFECVVWVNQLITAGQGEALSNKPSAVT